jgi:hypothetical protein
MNLRDTGKKLSWALECMKDSDITHLTLQCQKLLHSHQQDIHCPIISALETIQLVYVPLQFIEKKLYRHLWELAELYPKSACEILTSLMENL